MSVEDITSNDKSLVVFSSKGFIKRMPADTFSVQVLVHSTMLVLCDQP